MPINHYPDSAKETTRRLLAECGLTRESLLKIPRKMPLTPLELSRIETEKKSTRPKPGHWPDVPVSSNGSVRGEVFDPKGHGRVVAAGRYRAEVLDEPVPHYGTGLTRTSGCD